MIHILNYEGQTALFRVQALPVLSRQATRTFWFVVRPWLILQNGNLLSINSKSVLLVENFPKVRNLDELSPKLLDIIYTT